jgi:SAM-dependent methyltransferase
MNNENQILSTVRDYYSKKIKTHGATPCGVDWNSLESQETRFEQLLRIGDLSQESCLLDYGCGYGALFDFLARSEWRGRYTGFDISPEMILTAKHIPRSNAEFFHALPANRRYDYVVSSGIFNVRMDYSDKEWKNYIVHTLEGFDRLSIHGFSFNMLTSYSDSERMKSYLYYADPCFIFDLCKRKFSKNVALLHDYGLYEFSMLVKK